MKRNLHLLLTIFFCATVIQAQNDSLAKNNSFELKTSMDSMSYALGAFFHSQFSVLGFSLDPLQLSNGYIEAELGIAYLNEERSEEVMNNFQNTLMDRDARPFEAGETIPFNIDALSYAMGYDLENEMETYGVTINSHAFSQGAVDKDSNKSIMDDLTVSDEIKKLSQLLQEREDDRIALLVEPNIKKGERFLAEKALEKGVISTKSGLHYKVLRAGTGIYPSIKDKVTVHYVGRTIDGDIFDSSLTQDSPITFALNKVIEGWQEGLQLMKEGAKFELYIPSHLGYGKRGSPSHIEPGALIIFEIELIRVEK